ncbi:aldose 1-epimerase family protein [Pseudarthrobacter sp. C4D7]|uniref:aldose 1-epimerase family protein n=1 Tax=Pseudarthrobacter sp. C4D7 TaxID=2735268 RepID=UPI00158534D2|nr:aldose 1-epimerase family protein [Pseudarthrobacter sp. C4D7]NUT73282.1 aldose 1-epimerase family protein [Pseudarthrobacter sp. C4D7]
MNPRQYRISSAGYSAAIVLEGAAVRMLTHQSRDLIVPFAPGEPMPDYRGALVAPWPNRIPDGRYSFGGLEQRVPINEPSRAAALHGLVSHAPWSLHHHDEASIRLLHILRPSEGYPFELRLEVSYTVDEAGFHTTITTTNTGEHTAPYGTCPHPYLIAGPSPLDAWHLELNASTFLDVTPDRLIPIQRKAVDGTALDYRRSRPLGGTAIDHAFTDLRPTAAGRRGVTLWDPTGTGVAMSWGDACPWVQIHTADHIIPERHRIGLAVEPMTCPPNAFNSGDDLVVLLPAMTHNAQWSIHAL